MSRAISPASALRASRGLLAAAALLGVWTIGRAVRVPGDAPLPERTATVPSRTDSAPPAATDAEVARTIAGDLFSSDRSASHVPYRIERAGSASPVAAPLPLRLIGTVTVAGGRSFAMCQVGADPPRVVYPGQRIGAMRLESVSQGSATFTDNAGVRVVLRVSRAGS